jgi:uncharacterized RDD family membrane protein YckC
MFYDIYNRKSDDELLQIINSDDHTNDAKLVVLKILKERNILTEDLVLKEKKLIEQRETRIRNEVARDRYNTGFDRFVALIIDGFVLSIFGWVVNLFAGVESIIIIGLVGILDLLLPYLYSIILHGQYGQTFGKMIMNVKIFDKDEKSPISYMQALLRDIVPLTLLVLVQLLFVFISPGDLGILWYVSMVMMFFLLFWSLIEIVTMLFDSKKRAVHDYIAGTVVLKINN